MQCEIFVDKMGNYDKIAGTLSASKNCQHFTFHRYDGPPIPISDSPSIERNYKELCPQLFKGSDFIHIIHF